MINLHEKIYSTLATLNVPVSLQGSYSDEGGLPESFVTYQVIDSSGRNYAGNIEYGRATLIQVCWYATDAEIAQAADKTLRGVLLPSGFLRVSGRDLPLDTKTGHYGFVTNYRLFELED